MRAVKLLLWIILSLCPVLCSAQRMFSEVSSIKGVTSIYVGKTMLEIVADSPAIGNGDIPLDVSEIIRQLTSIEIVQCQSRAAGKKVEELCERILSKYPFEIITETEASGRNMTISGVFDKKGKYLSKFLISVRESGIPTYILMNGKIDMETIKKSLLNNSEVK